MFNKNSIFTGTITHIRRFPVVHQFTYPMYMFSLLLEELEASKLNNSLFVYDTFRLLSIKKEAHLGETKASIQDKALGFLHQFGINASPLSMVLLTTPRLMGYVFNPVSFIFCFAPKQKLEAIIVQINNTYDESHLYVLPVMQKSSENTDYFSVSCDAKKEFFVSPFNNLDGSYHFEFTYDGDNLEIIINLICDGKVKIFTQMKGSFVPYTRKNIIKTISKNLLYPITARMKIYYQALKLRKLGLNYLLRPWHKSKMTIKKNHHKHNRKNRL